MPTKKPTAAYPEEFKRNAVRLALESGKPQTVIARELGVGFSDLPSRQEKYFLERKT